MERRTIEGFPDYAIDSTGAVWRISPAAPAVEARYGPAPRKLSVVLCRGGYNRKYHPAVTLTRQRVPGQKALASTKRTIAQLMRDAWPGVEYANPKTDNRP